MRSAAAFILTLVASAIVSYCSLAPKIWAPFREDDQIQDQDQGRVLRPDDLRRMRSTASSYNPYDGPGRHLGLAAVWSPQRPRTSLSAPGPSSRQAMHSGTHLRCEPLRPLIAAGQSGACGQDFEPGVGGSVGAAWDGCASDAFC